MILTKHQSLAFFQFPNLIRFAEIRHGIFTRIGGISPAPYDSLNVSLSPGDSEIHIAHNCRRISQCMDYTELIFVRQVHGTTVVTISNQPADCFSDSVPEGDAILTNLPEKMLVIMVADCQAILLYDPVKKVIANIHSGWRGSIANIVGITVQQMQNVFGVEPKHLVAGVGPSLGPCCAEFINYPNEIPPQFWKYRVSSHHFDFWKITESQLCETGVLAENICVSEICTKCNTDWFFSYRKEGITGRFAAVIGLKG